MKAHSYSDLVSLTEAIYRSESARMQALLVEERRLRAELRQLEEVRRGGRDRPETWLQGYREIGADIMWQGWIGRSKAHLHADLARVLGLKGQVIGQLRRTYGKYHAASTLLQEQIRADVQRRENKRFDLLEDLGHLQKGVTD